MLEMASGVNGLRREGAKPENFRDRHRPVRKVVTRFIELTAKHTGMARSSLEAVKASARSALLQLTMEHRHR